MQRFQLVALEAFARVTMYYFDEVDRSSVALTLWFNLYFNFYQGFFQRHYRAAASIQPLWSLQHLASVLQGAEWKDGL